MTKATVETGPQSAAEFLTMRAAEAVMNKDTIAGVMVIHAYIPPTGKVEGPIVMQIWGGTEQGQVELLRKLADELERGGGEDPKRSEMPAAGRLN